jgi:DNA-binding NarL/FixJ family response regulator
VDDEINMATHVPLDLVLVDANRTLRKGTEMLLRSWGHHVTGTAGAADAGYDLIRKRRPDVALVDLDLPGGVEPVLRTVAAFGTRILLSLGQPDRRALDLAMTCGARGLVLQSADPDELREGLRVVGAGARYVAPAVEGLVALQRLNHGSALSTRERVVLQLLADGMTGAQASEHLSLSPETVRTHIRNAMRRLDARTRVRAVTIAVARGEIHS